MIYNVERSALRQPYRHPVFYNLVFGHHGGMQADITCLNAFRSAVPQNARWGVTHYGRQNWEFLVTAIAMGAEIVRIGFEDSAYLSPIEDAKYNHQLVARLVQLIHDLELEVATPQEARIILGTFPKRPSGKV